MAVAEQDAMAELEPREIPTAGWRADWTVSAAGYGYGLGGGGVRERRTWVTAGEATNSTQA